MPTYRITAPDGRTFRVTGPGTREEALAKVRAQVEQESATQESPPAESAEPPSFLDRARAGMNLMNRASIGTAETALQFITGAAAEPVAGLAGIAAAAVPGGKSGAEAVQDVRSAMTFQPRTQEGRAISEAAGKPFELVERGADIAGELVGDVTGSPAAATGAKTALLAAPMALGFRGAKAPAAAKAPTPKEATLAAAQREGYVVPPSSAKPSAAADVLEGAGGKIKTQQLASQRNQAVTNNLAARELGLQEGAQITPEILSAVRNEAGQAYEAIRGVDVPVIADAQYFSDLSGITQKYKGAAKDFPEIAKTDVDNIVAAARKPHFETGSAVDAIRILRDKADTAFRQGDKALGRTYREISQALEGTIERHLGRLGPEAADLLAQYRQARETIAKSYAVENALNPATGNVSATKLAAQLSRGKPLQGNLRIAAEFAQAFPKAARELTESFPALSPLDFGMGLSSAGAASLNPAFLAGVAYPLARPVIRNAILSRTGQRALTGPDRPPARGRAAVPIGAATNSLLELQE